MKKIIALVLSLCMVFALCAASASADDEVKIGLITLHDENSAYDKNFIDAFNAACEATGVTPVIKSNVPEDQSAYDEAANLADSGCAAVFTDSYGHQQYVLDAAREFPDVQFTSCTGDMALTEGVENYHNAFANIYQGRYIAGVAAGLKLNEMIDAGTITAEEAKMGYVGAMPYAEVISGYTSFYLGAKSVCPTVTMDVIYTGSWYDETLEKETAEALISGGAVLISQHADSMGAPNACEAAGVPNVSYNGSTLTACPNTYIISSRIDWTPYFTYAIEQVLAGENYDTDWTAGIETGSVALTELNENVAAAGTAEKLEEVEAAILDGSLNIFDCSTFTVTVSESESDANYYNNNSSVATVDADGHLTSYIADVENDGTFVAETEAVENGVFNESVYRSAPYFYAIIDGINVLSK
jgi:basic membrane protein A and related proteins